MFSLRTWWLAIRHDRGVVAVESALFLSTLQKPLRRDEGATAVEYGLMILFIALAIVTSVALVGTNLNLIFESVPPGFTP